ncbi:hypothetical protein [Bifidobacterium callimiconis]|uniref:Minor tail protein n=1 Tax=Bifidobacterium callimiconis TaxID=2306973 RepID=A0A430FIH8_9BIFI|nr:hypothetical protein [Bifidobacterium callimiconis]RSX52646.1 hypothetical protein D2E23_0374 [Bifidobacterium callimiconis]
MDLTHHLMEFTTSLRMMRVDRETGSETGRVDGILHGGTITRNQDTDVTETASLDYVGDTDLTAPLLRVWADLDYEDGTRESIALGTFLPDGPKREVTGGQADTTPLTLYGRLRELADDQFPYPVSLQAGEDPLAFIDETIREAGLTVADHPASDWRMGTTWTFGMGDTAQKSKLSAINELLTLMGWNSARTDPMGRVVLTPYVQPKDRSPSWTFTEGPDARFVRSMTDEHDWFDTRNQIIVIYSDQERDIRGLAVDDDPASAFSTITRGRVISETYTYNDIPDGMSDTDAQSMADAKAAELLATAQSVIRRVTFTHIYAPVTIGDVIRLGYPTGDVTTDLAIRTQTISLTAGLPVETEARSFSR